MLFGSLQTNFTLLKCFDINQIGPITTHSEHFQFVILNIMKKYTKYMKHLRIGKLSAHLRLILILYSVQ